jgi:hypothetical protein
MRQNITTLALAVVILATGSSVSAQRGRGAGPAQPPQTPQAAAPIDLTGYWVSIVNEDWRWRMVTPPKGDYASVANLMTPESRKVADSWDPSKDGSCLAYGAAGLMRMPGRLHITWENENTLKIETDAGVQTRRIVFDKSATPGTPSLQGLSVGEWERPGGGRAGGGRGGPAAAPAGPPAGTLKVVTTNMTGGWLRKNGVPYSEQTAMTEYFDRFATPGGDQWLIVTTAVSDPKYLTQEFVTSTHFRREPDASKWDPTPCKPVS